MAKDSPRLLIMAGESAADAESLPDLVRALLEEAGEVLVVTPVLVSGLAWLASDVDRGRYEADERLREVLGHIGEVAPGTPIQGEVGDDSPLTAFGDAIARFHPDHILVGLRGSDHAAWQERNLVELALESFHIPITVFEVDRRD